MNNNRKIIEAVCFIILLFCIYRLFLPHTNGSAFALPPDSIEYTLGIESLWKNGQFGIDLNHQFYPSRYLPWFSVTVLGPVVVLSGGNVMAGIYGVFLFSVLTLLLLFFMAKKNSGAFMGLAAASILYLSPEFREHSRIVMTEVPYTAMLIGMMYLFGKIVRDENRKWSLAGYLFLCLWAGSLRSTALPMAILPLFVLWLPAKTSCKRFLLILSSVLPSVIVLSAGMLWNKHAFGSCLRNGYQYWCSVPYDYPTLTFSVKYILNNLTQTFGLIYAWVAVTEIVVILIVLFRKTSFSSPELKKDFLAQTAFAFFQTSILLACYLPYFCSIPRRFFLPVPILLILPALLAVKTFPIPEKKLHIASLILACGAVIAAVSLSDKEYRFCGDYDEYLQIADRQLPEDAVLITSIDCAMASYRFCKKPARRILPFYRQQEYADKVVAPFSPGKLTPPPVSPTDHLAKALLNNSPCKLPFPHAFNEDIKWTAEFIKNNKVFIFCFEFIRLRDELRYLMPALKLIPINGKDAYLYRLVL